LSKVKKSAFLLLFLFGTLVFLLFPNTAYASPGTTTVDAYPTANAVTGGITVSDPPYAYDGNLGTYARFRYDSKTGAGTFEVKSFTTPSSNLILSVDFKMNYEADSGAAGELYRIVYYVGASGPVVLQDWTNAAYGPATRTWSNQAEPTDGSWSWADIGNIRFVAESGTGGGGAAYFDEYESWVTVTTYGYTTGTIFVDPASLSDPSSPFTVNINVSNVEDLYGWEFKLYYNRTILSNSSVTEGSFLSSAGSTYFSVVNNTDTYNATHGRYWVSCTLLTNTPGKTGSGTLATISFTVDGPGGTSPLVLADTDLIGYISTIQQLIKMNHNTTDGQVTISGVPEFPFGAALEMALAGVLIYIFWRGKSKQQLKLPSG
jgi:hypothetical protein